ncbi:hypothetical protein BCO18430_07361 [Burkholderia contaminans]|nr:hypothetical protein BCO19218_05724 [Burkholderia contaminans]VWD49437.1 hypothetical protein BCO18430_07361 [Burkholderia contaminans]
MPGFVRWGAGPAPPPPNFITARDCYESQRDISDSAHRLIVGCHGCGTVHDQPDAIRCVGCFRFGAGRVRQLYQQLDIDGGCKRWQYGDARWFRRYGIRLPQLHLDGQRFGLERGRVRGRRRYRCRSLERRKQQHERERECAIGRGNRHDRTRREPLYGCGRKRPGHCQRGCRWPDGQWRFGRDRGFESLQLVDRVEYRPGRFAIRGGRKPGQFKCDRKQSLVRCGGTSFPATLVSFPPHCCHVRSWHEAETDCRRSDARVSDGVWR